MKKRIHARYTIGLSLCLALFVFRVFAQLVQKFHTVSFLPPFDVWHSNTLPYPLLVAFQAVIIGTMAWVISGFAKGRTVPRRQLGVWLLTLGSVYFIGMVFRLIASFTFAAPHSWLNAKLPSFFHIVLASFVLMTGHFHYRYGKKS